MVFAEEDVLLALPSEAVVRVSAAIAAAGVDAAASASATRLLLLRSPDGQELPPLQTHSVLQMRTVAATQVCSLPSVCKTARCSVVSVVVDEDRVLFMVVDPLHYLQRQLISASSQSSLELAV